MRLLILAFILSACAHTTPPPAVPQVAAPASAKPVAKPTPAPPRNFVCETFAALNPSAVCVPERTEPHIHSARVTLDTQLIRCAITDTMTSIVCSEPIVVQMQPQPAPPPAPSKKGKRR